MEGIKLPTVIDPETGHEELIGNGRIAVLGQRGVVAVVVPPQANLGKSNQKPDQLATLIDDRKLTFSA